MARMNRPSKIMVLLICMGTLGLVGVVTGTGPVRGNEVSDEAANIQPYAIRAHMSFFADDLLEGRATGSRGYEIAAKYVASQFEALGLKPAGDQGTYFQNVPLRSTQPDEAHTTFSIARGGKEEVLTFRGD